MRKLVLVPRVARIRPKLLESKIVLALGTLLMVLGKRKFGWLRTLMALALNSRRTRSVIGIRFTKLASQSKYAGPLSELIGKLPKVPGAGAVINPGFKVELTNAPVVGFVVIVSRFGLMKYTPVGVRKIPTFCWNSANVIPVNCAGL